MPNQPHVVILGAGFGGIGALKTLGDADVSVTLIDKHDYHTFQPLLYQVATDELAPTVVGFPIRELLHAEITLRSIKPWLGASIWPGSKFWRKVLRPSITTTSF
jgi:NADH:ubiquinone reductase (H+-translocating)